MAPPPVVITVPVSVEISIGELTQGIFAIEGDLRYTGDALLFVYRTKDRKSRASAPETLDLPLDAWRDVTLKRRPRGARLVLHPRHLDVLDRVPGAGPETLTFRVSAAHREQAAQLVAHLQGVLAERDALSVPFTLPDMHYGMTEITGLLSLDDPFLVFDVGTGLPGGFQKEQRVIKIELKALTELAYTRGTLKDHLIVRPRKRDLLDAMPGTYEEALTLSIRKAHRADAEQLVYEARRLRREQTGP